MLTNLGTDGDIGDGEVLGSNLGHVVDVGVEGGGKVLQVVVQAFDHWNIHEKIPVIKLCLQAPDVVLVALNNGVQVGVLVLDSGICRDGKEVGVVGTEVVVSFFNW
jgi:hypothetical protein